jgi:hypothetical protein
MTRAKTKRSTPKARPPGATKPKLPPLTEAENRILKAVDVTRMLYEHKGAKRIGQRNRDMGFGMLLMHLDRAYKALFRYSILGGFEFGTVPKHPRLTHC